ncbi:MAG: hypothetical protein J0I34_31930 [Pseudonocardia sp.]|uniref:hypothetical protein n=1 Tax=unclassified Pseudonocardia TaxID=2619320 RepID=UPI001AD1F3DA|nr:MULTISPECIES: hypothetical protein [unclassified Pseudonocardia]MBN9113381.1 hypothetical protein [Pseudonocardia sp.]
MTVQWLAGRGLQDLTGWPTGLTSLGRWSGLGVSLSSLAQVLLMGRDPAGRAGLGARTGSPGCTAGSGSARSPVKVLGDGSRRVSALTPGPGYSSKARTAD